MNKRMKRQVGWGSEEGRNSVVLCQHSANSTHPQPDLQLPASHHAKAPGLS